MATSRRYSRVVPETERLPAGTLVSGEVTRHERWGLIVRLDDPPVDAIVDIAYVGDLPPKPARPTLP